MVDDRGTCNVWKDFPIAEKGRVKTAPSPHPDFRRAIGDVKKNHRDSRWAFAGSVLFSVREGKRCLL